SFRSFQRSSSEGICMSFVALAVAALLGTAPQDSQSPSPLDQPVQVEDVIVHGRRFEEAAGRFVSEVAIPAGTRGLARWRNGVCVGVVNLRADVAQHIIDRVSAVAVDLGLRAGDPGCRPNITITASDDASGLAASL